jgi:hypothetical protein
MAQGINMPRGLILALIGGVVAACAGGLQSAVAEDIPSNVAEETFFETRIRTVLAGTCGKCHGAEVQSGGLRLDSREALLKGGEHGPAVMPGDAEGSLLLRALKHDDDQPVQMPPERPLAEDVIADLTSWVAGGAKWPVKVVEPLASPTAHWAFRPLRMLPCRRIRRAGAASRSIG